MKLQDGFPKGRLSASRLSHQAYDLALVHSQIDLIHRLHGDILAVPHLFYRVILFHISYF